MAEYHFTTLWNFENPVQQVWEEIRLMDHWPEWWKYVRTVEKIREGDENEIGSIRRVTWSTALPYTIIFDSELTFLDPYRRMEGKAYGDLMGEGIWTFISRNGNTSVQYDWHVRTAKKWMNFFEPIATPLFKWNHDQVMKGGYVGLRRRLSLSEK